MEAADALAAVLAECGQSLSASRRSGRCDCPCLLPLVPQQKPGVFSQRLPRPTRGPALERSVPAMAAVGCFISAALSREAGHGFVEAQHCQLGVRLWGWFVSRRAGSHR